MDNKDIFFSSQKPIFYTGISLSSLLESDDISNLLEVPFMKQKKTNDRRKTSDISDTVGGKGDKICNEKEVSDWDRFDNAGAAFLGPQLWEKTIPCDTDLKLEYMDLDEFLNENNIEDELIKRNLNGGALFSTTSTTTSTTIPESPNPQTDLNHITSTIPPGTNLRTTTSNSVSPETSPHVQRDDPSSSSLDTPPGVIDSVTSPESSYGPESPASPRSPTSTIDSVLASVPGDEFDPRMRSFSEDELKPQPMIKKSRKQYVPHELKDDRYWARRRKNNVAAKRSRDARRTKENQIAMRASYLEKENDALKCELEKTLSLLETMKKRLSVYESNTA